LAGEEAAARALEAEGLRLLERRWRRRFGEIDLIAERGDLVVFVEVKTRLGPRYGDPAAAVTPRKRQRMARVAQAYLQLRGWADRPCRFDVVEVRGDGAGEFRVRHLADAFRLWPTG